MLQAVVICVCSHEIFLTFYDVSIGKKSKVIVKILAYYLGVIFINREWIALLESKFHFQIEYCIVTTVALFQIRNAD